MRPPINSRKFVSEVVEETILKVKQQIANEEIAQLFENCFPNTLDTTINFKIINGKPDTFVITGDINAMWLRDSTAQVWQYLSLINSDAKLKEMIKGVINRQTKCVLIDSYANAFTDGNVSSEWTDDLTEMKPGLHERKWELDSLCYTIRLAYNFWKTTGDTSCFDEEWRLAAKLFYKTLVEQQRKNDLGSYKFGRITAWSTDTVPGNGFGNPMNPNGLIVSLFRPSDDATIFPFLIPSNFFAAVSLKQLAVMTESIYGDSDFSQKCIALAEEVETALNDHAIVNHPKYGDILAYEIDGFENKLFMDDANIPNLLSLSYLSCLSPVDPLYLNTRKFVLSQSNPYYFEGDSANGVGSPHTLINRIWPMSIIMRAITSFDDEEIIVCLRMLKNTHAGTFLMHESFEKNNPADFTRSWFAWANSLFGELILKLFNEKPYILRAKI